MPLDAASTTTTSGGGATGKLMATKQRSNVSQRLASLALDGGPEAPIMAASSTASAAATAGAGESLEAPFRRRLHGLFAQIEKEFEALHLENVHCTFSTHGTVLFLCE